MRAWPWIVAGVVVGIALIGGGVYVAAELIKRFEGLRLRVYQDSAGKWTIGYGHLVQPGERFYPYGTVIDITSDEADALLAQDMADAELEVSTVVRVPLSPNQHDALVSFVFNVGGGAFADSTLLRKLNSGDYSGAASEFDKWVHANGAVDPGLVSRRSQEKTLFMTA